jgi:hypothetical protein
MSRITVVALTGVAKKSPTKRIRLPLTERLAIPMPAKL